MAKKCVGHPEGFADVSAPIRARKARPPPIDLQGRLDAILERRRAAEEATRAAVRRVEAERRAAEAARIVRFNQWIRARARLRSVVVEVEAVLTALGLHLSMADDCAHPVDLAAVEIRLFAYGRPRELCLDITVSEDGRQIARDVGGTGPPHCTALPEISRVTADHYRTAVLAYVERALPGEAETAVPPCRMCGRRVQVIDRA